MSCRSCPLDDLQSLWRNGSVLSKKSCKNLFPQPTPFQKKTPDHLEPENAAQKRHSVENVHDELQRSVKTPSNLQRKVAFCPPRRRRAPLLRCNMADLKSVYTKLYTKSAVSESSIALGRLNLTFLPLGLSLRNLAHFMFMATKGCLRFFNFCLRT